MTVGELTEWAIVRGWGNRNAAVLDHWLAAVPVIGYDEDVARRWGHLSAQTRRAGRPRPVNDMWNAACCLAENLPLATLNVPETWEIEWARQALARCIAAEHTADEDDEE